MPGSKIDEARIREAAYHLWLKEGRPEGRAEDHWHRAHAALVSGDVAPKARRAAARRKPALAPKPAAPGASAPLN